MIYYLVNIECKTVWTKFTNKELAERAKRALNQTYLDDSNYNFEIFTEEAGSEHYVQVVEEQAAEKLLK